MKHINWMKIGIVCSLILNGILGIALYTKDRLNESALEPLSLWLIQSNMHQLEGAIQHQQKAGWVNPSHVAEKLDDVIQGITVNIESRSALHELTAQEEQVLWQLHERLSRFPHDDTGFGITLTEEEKLIFARLGEQLRAAGWTSGVSFSSSMDEIIERAEKLLKSL